MVDFREEDAKKSPFDASKKASVTENLGSSSTNTTAKTVFSPQSQESSEESTESSEEDNSHQIKFPGVPQFYNVSRNSLKEKLKEKLKDKLFPTTTTTTPKPAVSSTSEITVSFMLLFSLQLLSLIYFGNGSS